MSLFAAYFFQINTFRRNITKKNFDSLFIGFVVHPFGKRYDNLFGTSKFTQQEIEGGSVPVDRARSNFQIF